MDTAEPLALTSFAGMSTWLLSVVCALKVLAPPSARAAPAMPLTAAATAAGSAIRACVTTPDPTDTPEVGEASGSLRLSILVVPDGVWIGVLQLHQFAFLPIHPDGTYDWRAVERSLRAYKTSPLFPDRTEIEIATRPGTTYQAFIRAMSVAEVAGFSDLHITSEVGLYTSPFDSAGSRPSPFARGIEQQAIDERYLDAR